MYVITDGNNVETTVILGVQKTDKFLMSTKVNILGYLSKDHESLASEEMVKNHMLNTRLKDCKVGFMSIIYHLQIMVVILGNFLN